MLKISIIVPIYNAEKYLQRCLDSIRAQTFTDWECILIDDGSTDNSGIICDQYAKNDIRFRVIHQENSGVSAARNLGLEVALGEWIAFVDSDDWIEHETYNCALESAKKFDADIVQWGFFLNDGVTDYDIVSYSEIEIHTPIMNSLWSSLIKRQLFFENKIYFPLNTRVAEDMFVMAKLVYYSNKTYVTANVLYHYFQNSTSATHTRLLENLEDECMIVNRIESFLLNENSDEKWLKWLTSRKISIKNKYIFYLDKPDFQSWRCKYKDVFPDLLKSVSFKQKIFFLLIFLHIDILAIFMYKVRFKLKNKNGRIQFDM